MDPGFGSPIRSVISALLALLILGGVIWLGQDLQRKDPAGFCYWRQSVTLGIIPCDLEP